MPSGCHGHYGLDPESAIHLPTYILPVLIYGMEVVLPKGKHLDSLEKFYKTIWSYCFQCLIEATIHKRALVLFGNICRPSPDSIEKEVAYRQLNIKSHKSNSWFVAIKELCFKYELSYPLDLIQDSPSKESWKRRLASRSIITGWREFVTTHPSTQVWDIYMRTNIGMGKDTLWYRLLVTLERFHVPTGSWNWWPACIAYSVFGQYSTRTR